MFDFLYLYTFTMFGTSSVRLYAEVIRDSKGVNYATPLLCSKNNRSLIVELVVVIRGLLIPWLPSWYLHTFT